MDSRKNEIYHPIAKPDLENVNDERSRCCTYFSFLHVFEHDAYLVVPVQDLESERDVLCSQQACVTDFRAFQRQVISPYGKASESY